MGGGGVSSRGGLVIDCPPGGWPGAAGSDRHLLQGMGPMPRHYYTGGDSHTLGGLLSGVSTIPCQIRRESFLLHFCYYLFEL